MSVQENETIEQKWLEVGHTQMEADSIHASIEKKLGNKREVFMPADYLPIIKTARLLSPYEATILYHDDFKEYEASPYKSIRPGTKVGDPCVTDLVALQYCHGVIKYKLSFKNDWTVLPHRVPRLSTNETVKKTFIRDLVLLKKLNLSTYKS